MDSNQCQQLLGLIQDLRAGIQNIGAQMDQLRRRVTALENEVTARRTIASVCGAGQIHPQYTTSSSRFLGYHTSTHQATASRQGQQQSPALPVRQQPIAAVSYGPHCGLSSTTNKANIPFSSILSPARPSRVANAQFLPLVLETIEYTRVHRTNTQGVQRWYYVNPEDS